MKIVYFDYWTNGLHNFKTIDSALRESGHETMLLHVGSWRFPHQEEQVIDEIVCRDISYYNTSDLYQVLKTLKPDVVITLNCSSLLDRSLSLNCKSLGIKTVFLMHGIRATGNEIDKTIEIYSVHYNSIFNKLKKGKKYLKTFIPNYVSALKRSKPSRILNLKFLSTIYSNFSSPAKNMFFPKNSDEIVTDKCLVYSNKYIAYYTSIGFPGNTIHVVGNPAYDALFKRIDERSFNAAGLPAAVQQIIAGGKKYAVYLEDGFVEQGNMGEWTNEFRSKLVNDIAERLKKENVFLVVKIHPSASAALFKATSDNMLLLEKTDLNALIYYSSFCFGHISTTVNVAVLLNKAVIVPQWSFSANIVDYYVKTNVAKPWLNIEDEIDTSIDEKSRDAYVHDSITVTKPVAIHNIVHEIVNWS